MLTKEQMLERSKRKIEEVKVKAWDDEIVYLRGMTGADRNSFLITAKDHKRSTPKKYVINEAIYAHELVARCLCDENGKRLFSDDESDLVGGFPSEVIDQLMAVAQRLSGLDGDEEAEKN